MNDNTDKKTSNVDVVVNNKIYHISCDSDNQAEVRNFASIVNRKINNLIKDDNKARNSLLFLITAIVSESDLKNAKDEITALKSKLKTLEEEVIGLRENNSALNKDVHEAKEYIDSLAQQVKGITLVSSDS